MANKQKIIHGFGKPGPSDKTRGTVKQCHCGVWFSLPSCHANRHNSCSAACSKSKRDQVRLESEASRGRDCAVCGTPFVPRQWQIDVGAGSFCSHRCASTDVSSRDSYKAAYPKRIASWRKSFADGKFTVKSGPENSQWKGGKKESARRQIESGKARQWTNQYRAANPHRVKEWAHKRSQGYVSKLPRGTVPDIYAKQRGRCAYCHKALGGKYHLDHIEPIARGGKHEPGNLQVLCQRCNVTKSAKCPVRFAQEIGMLL